MTRRLTALALSLLCAGLAAPALAQGTQYATTALRLRTGPSTESGVLLTIPAGASVSVSDCTAGWCSASYAGLAGYASDQYLSESRAPFGRAEGRSTTARGGRGYTNSQGDWTPSPRHADRPPAGASARCRDGTYSFSASRRGTCSHHGGVAVWL